MTMDQLFSPYMSLHELKWMLNTDALIQQNDELYRFLLFDERSSVDIFGTCYRIPVIFIFGEQDWTTPFCMVEDYFSQISAPYKEFITLRNTGHIPFIDCTEEFTNRVKKALYAARMSITAAQPPDGTPDNPQIQACN